MFDFPFFSVVGDYIRQLHLSIDHALAVNLRRDVYREEPKFVGRITLVKAIPFYGFHVGYRFFLKIYMLNPAVMTRLADLLQQGLIMNRKFQPYEAHLQYLLQFMADYNLYGCSYIEAGNARFRSPVPEYQEENQDHLWHSESVPPRCMTDDPSLPRVSHCSIEVDIYTKNILNRKSVEQRLLHHDFIERACPPPPDLKLVHSMAGLWRDETKRRKRRIGSTSSASSIFPHEALLSMSTSSRDSQPPGWIHEDEYAEALHNIAAEEAGSTSRGPPSFETFVQQPPMADTVNTALESVEDLFPENLFSTLGPVCQSQELDERVSNSNVVVDEEGIRQLGQKQDVEDLFPSDSDEELALETKAVPLAAIGRGRTLQSSRPDKTPKGAASTLEASPFSHNSPSRSPDKLTRGVCSSGVRLGQAPQIPLYPEILSKARAEGLISRKLDLVSPNVPLGVSSKRRQWPSGGREQHKRLRLERPYGGKGSTSPSTNTDTGIGDDGRTPKSTDKPRTATGPFLVQSRGASTGVHQSQPHGNQTLQFAVVKDPEDPNTKLRLSQQSSSYQSDGGTMKCVSFGAPSTSSPQSPSISKPPKLPTISMCCSSPPKPAADRQFQTPVSVARCSPRTAIPVVATAPPSTVEVTTTMQDDGLLNTVYQDAFYGDEKDVPIHTREYAGREFRLVGNTVPYLPDFDTTLGFEPEPGSGPSNRTKGTKAVLEYAGQRRRCALKSWEIAAPPPSFREVSLWKQAAERIPLNASPGKLLQASRARTMHQSQIEGPTPRNKHGFKFSQRGQSTSVVHEAQYMSTMSLEIHVNTRGKLVPNPEEDEVQCIFWCMKLDEESDHGSASPGSALPCGVIVLSEGGSLAQRVRRQVPTGTEVLEELTELDVLVRMVEIVRVHDPDILTGYEVHGNSWGYLIERARFKYDYDLCDQFSRMKTQSQGRFGKEADRWGFNTTSTIRVTGRHMINIWRAMRGELDLLQYTMENVVWHLLHRRIPHYSWETLTGWYRSGRHHDLEKVLRYFITRARLDIEILDANELVSRTSEQARLLGVDFFSVFSRGSQFKVESIMFRIAKPENFLLVSPSKKQVGGQNALECLPLVMEPQSAFYTSPVLVLDFQSLYPSIMIAYNYCYSTFLGRIVSWRGTNKMGFTDYKRREGLLQLLKGHINIAPNGMMYAKPEIRKSLLAKMLTEILETRVMVKSGMKEDKDDRALQRLLNNRQLALKLLANVTYGYTSASFSGRMPCSEIADSIVQTGRETLERAIAFIHSVERWGAEVVYGDTDSLFIHLEGRTRDQAFDIGNEIAKAVTDMNPRPIKLKFEKVYHPCILLAKKRYVGYKYESKDQIKPQFDAKGIETVRRDGTPAEQKIEEKALKLLFETADLSQVKAYFQAQCDKIMRGAVSVQDFCFAKEVRLGTYSNKAPPPPGALISTRRMLQDARAEPQYGERVPYVVTTGAPGARLIDRCVAPDDLVRNPHYTLDSEYYISKNLIPPLERIFNLVGANVRRWYDEMPKVQRVRPIGAASAGAKKTLESYLKSTSCVVCGTRVKGEDAVCLRCRQDAPRSMIWLQTRLNAEERKYLDTIKVCQSCASLAPTDDVACDSKDCPVFYTRVKQATRLGIERSSLDSVITELAGMEAERLALDW